MDLRRFRTETLITKGGEPFTQKDFGEALGVTQEQVSRWEKNPQSISVKVIQLICDTFGVKPTILLDDYQRDYPEALNIGDPFSEQQLKIQMLDYYTKSQLTEIGLIQRSSPTARMAMINFGDLKESLNTKPLIGFFGSSDSGKSQMINALCGSEILRSSLEPTTSIPMYLKHIDSRTEWIHDDVLILKKPKKPIDFRMFLPKSYYDYDHLIINSGGFELLDRYGIQGKSSGTFKEHTESECMALLYIDAPILQACDMVEIPITTAKHSFDDIVDIISQIDNFIFLSQARTFIDSTDISVLKDIFKLITVVYGLDNDINPWSRMLIVASQSHLLKDLSTIENGYDIGANLIWKHISDNLKSGNGTNVVTEDAILKRMVTYSLNSSKLRAQFEDQFTKMLLESMIPNLVAEMGGMVNSFKHNTNIDLNSEIHRFEMIGTGGTSIQDHYLQLQTDWTAITDKLTESRKSIQTIGKQSSKIVAETFSSWWNESFNAEFLADFIEQRDFSIIGDQAAIGNALFGLIESELNAPQEQQFDEWAKYFGAYIQELHDIYERIYAATSKSQLPESAFDRFMRWALKVTQSLDLLPDSKIAITNMKWHREKFQEATSSSPLDVVTQGNESRRQYSSKKSTVKSSLEFKFAYKVRYELNTERVLDQYLNAVSLWWDTKANDLELLEKQVFESYESMLNMYFDAVTKLDEEQLKSTLSDIKRLREIINNIVW
jgi:transcriptional regulator with XRE-family HTH domain